MSFKSLTISATLVLALFLGQAAAFWQYGHLFVARVAYDKLQFTKEGQAALAKANQVLKVYSSAHPDMTNLERSYPFVECATFADEIKAKGGSWQSNWHFVDQPYLDQGGSISDYPGFVFDINSVDKAIPAITDWIKGTGNFQNSFVYTTMHQELAIPEDQLQSYALRLLIHYIGDLHQPLHATARVNKQYPKGDAGGNFVTLPAIGGAKNLHSVWDSMMYAYTATPNMPFAGSDWDALGSDASTMESTYSFSASEWQNVDVEMWTNESFELAKSNVYDTVTSGKALSAAYIQKNEDAIKRQVVLGGLRLAYTIQHLFGAAASEEIVEEPSQFLQ